MTILILNEEEIRSCIDLDEEVVGTIEESFSFLSCNRAISPPVMSLEIPEHEGETHVKSAYIEGFGFYAVKIASGFHRNRTRGLPTGSGMMVLLDSETGFPACVLLENGFLTDIRTGAAGAVAAKHLARDALGNVGLIGAGMQARFQVRALSVVRKFERLSVYNIDEREARAYAREMADELGLPVEVYQDPEQVVRMADLLITATPARDPIVLADWIQPGLHITAMGSDAEEKQELQAEALLMADLLVCDLRQQAMRLGEIHHAFERGLLSDESAVLEIGDIITGKQAGRTSDSQITICDLTGVGVQDTAIANLAYRRAIEMGYGTEI